MNVKNAAKKLSFRHKLWFSNPYIFATWWCRPLIFQTLNSVRLKSLRFKFQMFTPSRCKDRGIRKFELVAKTPYFKDLGLSLNRLLALIFSGAPCILAKTEIKYFRRPPLSFNQTVVCSSRTCRKLWRAAALTESTLIVVFDHKQRFQTRVPSTPPTHTPTLFNHVISAF